MEGNKDFKSAIGKIGKIALFGLSCSFLGGQYVFGEGTEIRTAAVPAFANQAGTISAPWIKAVVGVTPADANGQGFDYWSFGKSFEGLTKFADIKTSGKFDDYGITPDGSNIKSETLNDITKLTATSILATDGDTVTIAPAENKLEGSKFVLEFTAENGGKTNFKKNAAALYTIAPAGKFNSTDSNNLKQSDQDNDTFTPGREILLEYFSNGYSENIVIKNEEDGGSAIVIDPTNMTQNDLVTIAVGGKIEGENKSFTINDVSIADGGTLPKELQFINLTNNGSNIVANPMNVGKITNNNDQSPIVPINLVFARSGETNANSALAADIVLTGKKYEKIGEITLGGRFDINENLVAYNVNKYDPSRVSKYSPNDQFILGLQSVEDQNKAQDIAINLGNIHAGGQINIIKNLNPDKTATFTFAGNNNTNAAEIAENSILAFDGGNTFNGISGDDGSKGHLTFAKEGKFVFAGSKEDTSVAFNVLEKNTLAFINGTFEFKGKVGLSAATTAFLPYIKFSAEDGSGKVIFNNALIKYIAPGGALTEKGVDLITATEGGIISSYNSQIVLPTLEKNNKSVVSAINVANGKNLSLVGDLTIFGATGEKDGCSEIALGKNSTLTLVPFTTATPYAEYGHNNTIDLNITNGLDLRDAGIHFAKDAKLVFDVKSNEAKTALYTSQLFIDTVAGITPVQENAGGKLSIEFDPFSVIDGLNLSKQIDRQKLLCSLLNENTKSLDLIQVMESTSANDVLKISIAEKVNDKAVWTISGTEKGASYSRVYEDAELTFGVNVDKTNAGKIKVSVIATKFPDRLQKLFDDNNAAVQSELNHRAAFQVASAVRDTIYNQINVNVENKFNIWASIIGSTGKSSADPVWKMACDMYGFMLGADSNFTEQIKAGAFFAFAKSEVNEKESCNINYSWKNRPKSYLGGIYARWMNLDETIKVKLLALGGRMKHKETYNLLDFSTLNKLISAGTNEKTTCKHNANVFGLGLDVKYTPWMFSGINIGPWVNVAWTHNKIKAYDKLHSKQDEDHQSILSFSAAKMNSTEMILGLAADYDLGQGKLDLGLGYLHDFRHNKTHAVITKTESGAQKVSYDDIKTHSVGKHRFAAKLAYEGSFNQFGVSVGITSSIGKKWKDLSGGITASYSF